MLKELYIENFALISSLTLELGQGLHMITGETGSGKSILIDALSFCLGKRGDKSVVRDKSKKAIAEALFSPVAPGALLILEEAGIEVEDTLVLTRELTAEGKTTARVNHRPVNNSLLKALGNVLINIHGQNEFESLSGSDQQLRLLDAYLGERISTDLKIYQEQYKARGILQEKLLQLQEYRDQHQIQRELELLAFQIQEIDEAQIKEGEQEALEEELRILSHSEKIRSSVEEAQELLDGDSKGILSRLSSAARLVQEAGHYHKTLEEYSRRLYDCYYELEDVKSGISDLGEELDFDPQRLDEIQQRMDQIHKLSRKYGNTREEILAFQRKSQGQLEEIQSREERSQKYKDEIALCTEAMEQLCQKLNGMRREGAREMSHKILEELKSLHMKNVNFDMAFSSKDFGPIGNVSVDYLVSFNKGEEMKSLNKVASGGEVSRFMLAFKHVAAQADTIDTLIFDEIDTGVSGAAAQGIGEKMTEIAKHRQVISITHLPQIAAWAQIHYNVEKVEEGSRMETQIRQLDKQQRIEEIAKMIGGLPVTEIARANAKELLDRNNI